MNKLKVGVCVLVALLCFTSVSVAETAANILIDGERVAFTAQSGQPFVDENNRTQVPFRVTMESYGANVDWQGDTRTAIAVMGDTRVEITINEPYIMVNGARVENDTVALLKDGRTYLPIRKVLEAFRADVSWEGATSTVVVKRNEIAEDVQEPTEEVQEELGFPVLRRDEIVLREVESEIVNDLMVDEIEYPFEDDPDVIGAWKAVDYVPSPESFHAGSRHNQIELWFSEIEFYEEGRTSSWYTWTNGLLIHDQEKTASPYFLAKDEGKLFLFMEWKSGDYTIRHQEPYWYVFEKE